MKQSAFSALRTTMLVLVSGCTALQTETPPDMLGTIVPVAQATRTVAIDADTHHVRVIQYDTVQFTANGQSFGFRFDGIDTVRALDLRRVAPSGMLDRPVIAHIERDTRYLGSDRESR